MKPSNISSLSELSGIEPPRAPASGGNTVVARSRIRRWDGGHFRNEHCAGGIVSENGRSALCDRTAGEPGTVDVSIRNLNGSARLEDAFSWYEDLLVDDVSPPSEVSVGVKWFASLVSACRRKYGLFRGARCGGGRKCIRAARSSP